MDDSVANLSLPPGFDDDNLSLPGVMNSSAAKTPAGAARRAAPAFGPGELLANRFRVLRFVARGGMGEVYEAEDLELQETIALKTVLPAIASDPKALALLKAEVQLSRKVTHPNVCRIFDLSCHRSTAADVAPIWFVTMELLKGHTLSQEIQKKGKLTEAEALPLAMQMADGLEAARRANIVHGDFKSSNVLLTARPDGSLRAVVTDFGLARTVEAVKESSAQSVGTPAYMAPEQVKGEALSSRTDVYSFGVVLYEMVTGQWPFNADTPKKIAEKRLTEAPTPPTRLVPKLEPVWNRVILTCLEREPAKRYDSATDAMDAITGRSRYRKALVIAALLLICVGGAGVALAKNLEWGPFRPRPQIAVIGWHNRSGQTSSDWIGTELSERLTSALETTTNDLVVPQQDIDRAKIEFSIPGDRDLEKENLSQFRTALGANAFVAGSYDVRDSRITVDGLLQDAKGAALARFHQEGSSGDLAQVVSGIVAVLAKHVDTKEASQQRLDSAASIYPKSLEGRRLYFEALEQLRSFDATSARNNLQQLVALEKDCTGAHTALAEAWFRLKYDSEAVKEGQIAADLAEKQNLPPELLQATQARYAALQQNWSDASARYKSLHDFFPEELRYSLEYAGALVKDGHPAPSLAFLDKLALSPSPIGDDPRIQVVRAEAFAAESKYAEQVKAAQQSLTYATQRREKLMQANAQLAICGAERNTGQSDAALAACEAAATLFSAFGDEVSAAVALNGEANIKMQHSDYKEARDAYQRVLRVTTAAHADVDTAGALLNVARAEIALGDSGQAVLDLQKSIDLARSIQDHGDESRARIILGNTYEDALKLPEAKDQYQQALAIAQAAGDRDAEAFGWSNLGQVATEQHALPLAEDDLGKAMALRTQMNEPHGVVKLTLRLADVALQRGNAVQSRSLADEARVESAKLNDPGTEADALVALGEADLAAGDGAASLREAAAAIVAYQGQHDTDSEAEAHLLRARAFLKGRDGQSASAELSTALGLQGITAQTRADAAKVQDGLAKLTNQ